jgi:hypothetical protein
MYYMKINKNFVHQVGNKLRLSSKYMRNVWAFTDARKAV